MKNIQMEESEISVRVEVGAVRVSMYSCVGLPLCPVFVCVASMSRVRSAQRNMFRLFVSCCCHTPTLQQVDPTGTHGDGGDCSNDEEALG